jgi:hypothetical protein
MSLLYILFLSLKMGVTLTKMFEIKVCEAPESKRMVVGVE